MTDTYNDTTGSRKKFLIPLVVLLLCAVSLTGAGYAYNSTVTSTDNTVTIDGVTLELKDGQSHVVNAPMYTVSNIHIATHTTNGYALKYGGNGFTTIDSQAQGQAHAGKVVDTQGQSELNTFKTGYYVETIFNDSVVGYKAPAPVATDIDSAQELTAAVNAGTVYKIGDNYTLTLDNQNKDATKDIKVTLTAKWEDEVNFGGLYAVFVVVKSGNDVVAVETVRAHDDAAAATQITADAAAGTTNYTIEAYVALTDYYAASIPAALAGNAPTGFFNESFTVNFSAETVAAA